MNWFSTVKRSRPSRPRPKTKSKTNTSSSNKFVMVSGQVKTAYRAPNSKTKKYYYKKKTPNGSYKRVTIDSSKKLYNKKPSVKKK